MNDRSLKIRPADDTASRQLSNTLWHREKRKVGNVDRPYHMIHVARNVEDPI